MAYEIVSARFANAEDSAVVITTEDWGDVVISERDRPELWAKWQTWRAAGGAVAPYQAPPEPEPARDLAAELDAMRGLLVEKGVMEPARAAPGKIVR